MKRTLFILLSSVVALSNIYAADKEDAVSKQTIHKQADQTLYPANPEFFRGKVTPRLLFDGNEYITGAALVRFEKGARTVWHNHPAGQNLIVTGGTIYTGTRDGVVQVAHKGDAVICPPDVDHWHGAGFHQHGEHVALTGTKNGKNVNWKEHLSDEAYRKLIEKTGK